MLQSSWVWIYLLIYLFIVLIALIVLIVFNFRYTYLSDLGDQIFPPISKEKLSEDYNSFSYWRDDIIDLPADDALIENLMEEKRLKEKSNTKKSKTKK